MFNSKRLEKLEKEVLELQKELGLSSKKDTHNEFENYSFSYSLWSYVRTQLTLKERLKNTEDKLDLLLEHLELKEIRREEHKLIKNKKSK